MASGPARLSEESAAISEGSFKARENYMLTAQDNATIARAHYDAFN